MSNPANIAAFIAILLATYLMASLSSAIVVCHLFGLPDPRTSGSKNPGATNVLRIGSKLPAFLTLLGDVLKGFIPALAVSFIFNNPLFTSITIAVAFLGHCFPIYYGFEGGKGVATSLGSIFALSWVLGVIVCLTWLVMAVLFRFSSLASMVSLTLCPVIAWLLVSPIAAIPLCIVTAMTLYRHRLNIVRLYQGTETKIGAKKSSDAIKH